MYTLNNLMRNVLITTEEVMFHVNTKHTLDSRMIEQSIIIAEERFIRPEIGFNLYDEIVTAKNVEVTSINLAATQTLVGVEPILVVGNIVNAFEYLATGYQSLWKQHLWKLTAECVLLAAFQEGFIQFSSEGTFHTVPPAGLMVTSGLVTPLLPSIKWSIDKKMQDRIAPLLNSMHSWLCKYKTAYPLYVRPCPDCKDGSEKVKESGIALSLYDEVDDPGKCCKGRGWYTDIQG